MPRILAIDFGTRRCGIAVTDPLQIIVTALDTIDTQQVRPFLEKYLAQEQVEKIILGEPTHKDGTPTYIEKDIQLLLDWLKNRFPLIQFDRMDERYTSLEAKEIIQFSVPSRKKRQEKSLVDKISAVLILQRYLGHV